MQTRTMFPKWDRQTTLWQKIRNLSNGDGWKRERQEGIESGTRNLTRRCSQSYGDRPNNQKKHYLKRQGKVIFVFSSGLAHNIINDNQNNKFMNSTSLEGVNSSGQHPVGSDTKFILLLSSNAIAVHERLTTGLSILVTIQFSQVCTITSGLIYFGFDLIATSKLHVLKERQRSRNNEQ